MEEFFYWLGVIYSVIFCLMGLCGFIGIVTDYFWGKMKNAHGLMEIMFLYKKYGKKKGD